MACQTDPVARCRWHLCGLRGEWQAARGEGAAAAGKQRQRQTGLRAAAVRGVERGEWAAKERAGSEVKRGQEQGGGGVEAGAGRRRGRGLGIKGGRGGAPRRSCGRAARGSSRPAG